MKRLRQVRWLARGFKMAGLLTLLAVAEVTHAAELNATLQWSQPLELSTTVSGVIDKVLVKPGQRLKKGEALLELDQREFQAGVDHYKAQELAGKTIYDEANRELTRTQEMYDRTMLSEHDLQVAKNNQAKAKADFLQAQANLQSASIDLERSVVRAPYNCLVIRVMAQPGQTVVSTMAPVPLVAIAGADRLIARAWISVEEVQRYAQQSFTQVKVGERAYPVMEQRIALQPDGQGRYALDIYFSPGEQLLRAGQQATLAP